MVNLKTFLIGALITNSKGETFRIIEINDNGNIFLKDTFNRVILTDFKSVINYKINLNLECVNE